MVGPVATDDRVGNVRARALLSPVPAGAVSPGRGREPTVRILIADDDRASRLLLTATLERLGYQVVATSDGTEAWDVMQGQEPPRLLVLDWMMPGMDGVEVCRRVRSAFPHEPIYIVLLTGKSTAADVVAGLEAGANDYLRKPFEREELAARLRSGTRVLDLETRLAHRVRELSGALAGVERQTAALRESEARTRAIVETSLDGILLADAGGVVRQVNAAAARILGGSAEAFVGRLLHEVLVPERFRAVAARHLAAFAATGRGRTLDQRLELTACRLDGTEFPAELATSEVEPGALYAAFVRDLSERKRLEIELRHAQKLESVGQLAAGIAHEINTPIQFVGDNTALPGATAFDDLRALLDALRGVRVAAGGRVDPAAATRARRGAEEEADLAYLTTEVPTRHRPDARGRRPGRHDRAGDEGVRPPRPAEDKAPADLNRAPREHAHRGPQRVQVRRRRGDRPRRRCRPSSATSAT